MSNLKGQTQLKKLRLHYFHIRGSCQPIRNLLYYLNVEFEDIRHDKNEENQMEVGFNLGFPMLQDGEIRVHDAIAIMIYLCKKYQKPALIGLTPQHIARVQESLMKYSTQRKKINGNIFESIRIFADKNDREAQVEIFLKKLANQCKFVDFCLRSLAKGKKFIFDQLTIVDFIFYEISFYVCGFFEEYIDKQSIFQFWISFKKDMEEMQFYKSHQKQIESVHLFLEFGRKQFNQLIEESWKGNKIPLLRRLQKIDE